MATMTSRVDARIDGVDVSAREVPTATEQESDGTLVWDSGTSSSVPPARRYQA